MFCAQGWDRRREVSPIKGSDSGRTLGSAARTTTHPSHSELESHRSETLRTSHVCLTGGGDSVTVCLRDVTANSVRFTLMAELEKPRSLGQPGPDAKPVVEWRTSMSLLIKRSHHRKATSLATSFAVLGACVLTAVAPSGTAHAADTATIN